MKNLILLTVFLLGLFGAVNAQEQKKKADDLYNLLEYYRAVDVYKDLLKQESKNQNLCIRIGDCYRMMNDYLQAQLYYDRAKALGQSNDAQYYLHYGMVLRNNEKYKEAKDAFTKYISMMPGDPKGELYLQACNMALEIKGFKSVSKIYRVKNVTPLNSNKSDFSPVFFKDGIVFTSSRKNASMENKVDGWTGDYYLDLFYSEMEGDPLRFKEPILFSKNISQDYHDGISSFSSKNDTVYFTRVKYDLKGKLKRTSGLNRMKIFYSFENIDNSEKPQPFYLNNDSYSIAHPFISPDGKHLYFASDMPGGFGETDIYVCDLDGEVWGAPKNLGPMVNTFARESFPTLDSAGNLFFASEGYVGLGGLEICKAEKDDSIGFIQSVPLQFPINSSGDDFGIIFKNDGKSGYFSSNRSGGMGKDDIYFFSLEPPPPPPAKPAPLTKRIIVNVIDKDTRKPLQEGFLWVYDYSTDSLKEMQWTNGTTEFTKDPKDRIIMKVFSKGYSMDCKSEYLGDYPENPVVFTFELSKLENDIVINNILYNYDKSDIRPEGFIELRKVAELLKNNPTVALTLDSYCDQRGNVDYNIKLSQRRSGSCVTFLASQGISLSRLRVLSHGKSGLINLCPPGQDCPESVHSANRRTELKISGSVNSISETSIDYIRNSFRRDKGSIACDDIHKVFSVQTQDNLPTGATFYSVQVASYKASDRDRDFAGLADLGSLTKIKEGSNTCYLVGAVQTRSEADRMNAEIIKRGFNSAYVVRKIVDNTGRK